MIKQQGVTLVELMITIVVLAILVTLAAPSFSEFRERQALRGAADSMVATLGLAKEEAVKRDNWVRVDFMPMGTAACIGAAVVTSSSATSGCDCSSGTCSVAAFPESEADFKQVKLSGDVDFGGGSGFVIDPRTGTLVDIADTGEFELITRSGYAVAIQINAMARPTICSPAGAAKTLPGVSAC